VFLTLDQGSTSSRALIFDADGRLLAKVSVGLRGVEQETPTQKSGVVLKRWLPDKDSNLDVLHQKQLSCH
jgi:hypothetical protein